MENAGWIALIIVGIILAIVLGLWKFSKDRETNTNKKDTNNIRLRYEDYTQAEAQYVKNALQNGCEFNRLYSLQQAGYKPEYIVMYVKLRELSGRIATKNWYLSKMNLPKGRYDWYGLLDYKEHYILSAEEQVFEHLWNWCISNGYLVEQYGTPSDGSTSMLMYENCL